MRSSLSPLMLAGCLAQLSGSLSAGCILVVAGLLLFTLMVSRPYLEIRDGEAFQVGLLTGGRRPVGDLAGLLSVRSLRWFLRKRDLEQVQRIHADGGGAMSA